MVLMGLMQSIEILPKQISQINQQCVGYCSFFVIYSLPLSQLSYAQIASVTITQIVAVTLISSMSSHVWAVNTTHGVRGVSTVVLGSIEMLHFRSVMRTCVLVSNAHIQYLLSWQWFVNNFGVCTVCNCDEERSVSLHCSDDGICQCKPGASGRRCDSCLPGYTWRGNGSGCTGELVLHFYNYCEVLIKLN